jgi:thiol:disulfide interchange protein
MASRTLVPVLIAFAAIASFFTRPLAGQLSPLGGGDNSSVRAELKPATLSVSALKPGEKSELSITLEIKPGFHAQSRTPIQDNLIKFEITLDEHPAFIFGEPVYPKGEDHEYPALGKLNVYTGNIVVKVPVEAKADAPGGNTEIKGKVRFQICDDKSCFAPTSPKFSVSATILAPLASLAGASTQPATSPTAPTATSPRLASAPPVAAIDETSAQRGALAWFAIAFLAGVLFNIVPCVLPVLPIKVLGFAEVAQHNRGKTLLLASVFGAGIVTVFAILAMLILVWKKIGWGEQFANPWFAWGIVLVLLTLSLWLFGILNFNLPAKAYAFAPRHDTYLGNYQWGILTAILSTPCTGPLFPPLMLWAQQQPTSVGVPAFMMVGVGMAFPYIALAAVPEVARKFPRVGPFAELFKQMLGFVLLGFTVFFAAGRFTHPAGQWWAVVPIAVMAALYLMARTVQLSKEARPVAISSFAAVAIVTVSVLVACRFSGVFDPDSGASEGRTSSSSVAWTPYSDAALEAARKANKIVLVKFTANWCLNCQYVEATVFHDARAIAALRDHDVVTIKADLSDEDAAGWPRLKELLPTGGIPLTAIYAPGYEKPVQITSVYTTDTLVETLKQIDPAQSNTERTAPVATIPTTPALR